MHNAQSSILASAGSDRQPDGGGHAGLGSSSCQLTGGRQLAGARRRH